jgi:hypothetical protein
MNTINISASKFKTKRPLILIMLTCILPILASYTAFYLLPKRENTVNHGILVNPQRDIPEIKLLENKSLYDFKGKWILLIANSSNCDDKCAKKLYIMRQLRHTQGKEAGRIVPIWLITDNNPVSEQLSKAYADDIGAVKFLRLQQDATSISNTNNVYNWLNIGDIKNNIYLIDPQQHLMMYYNEKHEPKGMIKDITKLLKWSRVG